MKKSGRKIRNWPRYLKEFREARGFSQKQLADALQISPRNIENWEEGVNKPPEYLKKALDLISGNV